MRLKMIILLEVLVVIQVLPLRHLQALMYETFKRVCDDLYLFPYSFNWGIAYSF